MFNECAAPNCTSGYAINEKKQIAKFHFSPKNAEFQRKWIGFVNRRDWVATKDLGCCVNYILKTNIYGEVKNTTVVDESCTHCLSPKPFK